MKKMSIYKKILAVLMSALLVLSMTACGKNETQTAEETTAEEETAVQQPVYTATPGEVKKSETVYVNINNDGSVSNISVTDWLHTDKGEVCVNDISSLENIESIKDDTVPVRTKDGIQWNMTGTDLYYSGTTDKELPVEIELNYYLDGEKISPDKIAGKSGSVKIEVNMKNTLFEEVKIDGKKQKIYLPVLVVGGFILPESEFSGVEVTNGRAIGDGTKQIAVMLGLPGMSESLGLSELDLDGLDGIMFGNTAYVTAEATDFELGNMYFAAVPLSSLNLSLDTGDTMQDLKDILSVVSQVQDLLSDMDVDAVISLMTGSNGNSNIASLLSETISLYNDNKVLIDVLSKYASKENAEQLKKLVDFIVSDDTLKALEILSSSEVVNFFANLSELSGTIPLASSILADLQAEDVKKAIDNLPETIEKLENIRSVLTENKDTVDYLISLLSEENMDKISNIVDTISQLDLSSMEDKYSSLAGSAGPIASRAEKWIEFGKDYRIFTEATDEEETSVLFVYMTPSISKKVTEETTSSDSSGESILDSFIKKFR